MSVAQRIVAALSYAFPDRGSFATWNLCDEVLPHATVGSHVALKYELQTAEAAHLLYTTASCLLARQRYAGVRDFLTRATELSEARFGSNSREALYPRLQLAQYHLQQGDMATTEAIIRSLESRQDEPAVLLAMGEFYLNTKQSCEAQQCYRAVVEMEERSGVLTHERVIGYMGSGMACSQMDKTQWKAGEREFLTALRLCVDLYGKDRGLEADILEPYCVLLRSLGRKNEARWYELRLRLLKMRRDSKYPSYPHVAYVADIEDMCDFVSNVGEDEEVKTATRSKEVPREAKRNGAWRSAVGKTEAPRQRHDPAAQ